MQNQTYIFKIELINFFISYRCKLRAYKVETKISIKSSKILSTKDDDACSLKFVFSGEHENHPKNITLKENIDNIKTEKENLKLAWELINKILELPIRFSFQK